MKQEFLEKYKDKIIDGTGIAEFIKFELQQKIQKEKIRKNLATVLIGDDENSKTYLKLKKEFADYINVGFYEYIINENETENNIMDAINFLNNDEEINGIIIQLPIPEKFNQDQIVNLINRDKDVDGFLNDTKFNPVMGKVIFKILQEYDDNINSKKNISIISNSDIFSNRIEYYLKQKLNSADINKIIFDKQNLNEIKNIIKNSDIVISAVGEKHYIKKDFIEKDAIVIDIGITKEGKKIYGDADIYDIIDKVKYITPPIGGVGPMTVAILFDNLING